MLAGLKVLEVQIMSMYVFNLKSVNLKLSVKQEERVVLASLRKHCDNLERELLNHAMGHDSMSAQEVADNLTFIECAKVVMRRYGD